MNLINDSVCLHVCCSTCAMHACHALIISYFVHDAYSIPLPSVLGRQRCTRSSAASSRTRAPKVVTWDRTIVCLPSCYPQYCRSGGGIAIPRKKRSILAANGLIGKIHLESDGSEDELFTEIRSVFSDPMDGDARFPLKSLLLTGSGTKSLTIPSLSSSYKLTPKEVTGRADSFIYILAEKDLKNEVQHCVLLLKVWLVELMCMCT